MKGVRTPRISSNKCRESLFGIFIASALLFFLLIVFQYRHLSQLETKPDIQLDSSVKSLLFSKRSDSKPEGKHIPVTIVIPGTLILFQIDLHVSQHVSLLTHRLC